MKISSTIAAVLFVAATASQAQQPAAKATPEPLPPGPLIQARAPAMSQWVIMSASTKPRPTQPGGNESAPTDKDKAPKSKVVLTKTGSVMRQDSVDENQRLTTTWCIQGLQITVWADGKNWFTQQVPEHFDPDNPPAMYTDFSKSDFQGFEWISKQNYRGMQDVNGRKCIVFQDPLKVDAPTVPNSAGATNTVDTIPPKIATIDLETRLPVALVTSAGAHLYTFQTPPAAELTLPALVQSLLDNRKKSVDSLARRQIKAF